MRRRLLLLTLAVTLAAPVAADARTVAVDRQTHSIDETVVITSFIDRAAPRGWHYVVAVMTDDEGEEIGGEPVVCDSIRTRQDFDRRRRPFTVRLRPTANGWCTGGGRAFLLIERNGGSRIKIRGQSLRLRFVN